MTLNDPRWKLVRPQLISLILDWYERPWEIGYVPARYGFTRAEERLLCEELPEIVNLLHRKLG